MATSAPTACASANGTLKTSSATNSADEMHDEADRADHREQQEAQRHHVVGQLRQHQPEKIQRHHGIELALAVHAASRR